MLDYLDELCAALLGHDAPAIKRLLRHPFARALPRDVREEALGVARARRQGLRAPVRTLRFYHQTVHLLGTGAPPRMARPGEPRHDMARPEQLEIPLRLAR